MGDPFVLRDRGRFYLYGTSEGPPPGDGRVVPVFRSDDLVTWEPLGGALEPLDASAEHWAPEVLPWNGRYYMVVSFGDVEHRGHALWVAVADRPEGPFRLGVRVSAPDERFSIDGSWFLDDDGRLYLFRCLDFTAEDDAPHGTGIVVQAMLDPLTPAGPPSTVLRAHSPWQLFEANRTMPLYEGRTFAEWTTIEGPAPVRRGGRYYCGYSGGNFSGSYGTGEASADAPLGPYIDLRGREGPLFGTTPGLVEGPGHFSIVRPDSVHDWIVLHGRSPGEAVRRVWLCPATWGPEGVSIGRLTDQAQAAPPLPTTLTRWAGAEGLGGWTATSGEWSPTSDGLHHTGQGGGEVRLGGLEPARQGSAAVDLRLPESGNHRAGLDLGDDASRLSISIPADPAGRALLQGGDGGTVAVDLPTLGQIPFDPSAFHRVEVRIRGGLAQVRLDGVVLAEGLPGPEATSWLGLRADGPAVFDAATWTRIDG